MMAHSETVTTRRFARYVILVQMIHDMTDPHDVLLDPWDIEAAERGNAWNWCNVSARVIDRRTSRVVGEREMRHMSFTDRLHFLEHGPNFALVRSAISAARSRIAARAASAHETLAG